MKTLPSWTLLLALGGALGHAPCAHAEAPTTEADTLVRQGVELRRRGRDAEALEVFRRAYALRPSARVRAQIGLAEEAVSDWLNAEQDIASAASESDPWIAHNAEPLRAALRDVRGHLASLDVEGNVEGAEVWIDGTLSGRLPLTSPLRVVAGSLKLSVTASGFDPVEQALSLPAGAELKETVELRPIARKETPAEPAEWPRPAPKSLEPSPALVPLPAPPPDGRPERRTAAWLLVGTGGALLAGGVVATVVSRANASVYDDDSRCFYGSLTRDERCGGYRDRTQAATALAIAGYSLSALALAGAAVGFLVPHKTARRAASVGCGFAGNALSCEGTF